MNIPLPDYGHWMRIQHNIICSYKELPDNFDGENNATFTINDETDRVNAKHLRKSQRLENEILSDKNYQKRFVKIAKSRYIIVAVLNDLI